MSGLNKLAYRGFEEADKQADKDRLIEQGFTVVEDDKGNPFISPQTALERRSAPPVSAVSISIQSASSTPRSTTGAIRDKQIFRAAFDYMAEADKILSSATTDAGKMDKAWDQVTDAGVNLIDRWDDAFVVDMFTAIQNELYRRYFEEPLSSSASATESR